MANLTSKELDALEDQLNFEHTCVCKYQAAAQETTEIYTLSLHDALPISGSGRRRTGQTGWSAPA